MSTGTEHDVQTCYARIAGFVYLLLIVLFMGGQFMISHATGTGSFSERVAHISQGQVLYRAALVLQLLASVFTVLLAYSLYVVLKPVNERVARMALYWRLGEAFAGLGMFVTFATLSLQTDPKYAKALGTAQLEAIVDLAKNADFASFNIAIVFFSFGSTLFYYLFLKTHYIPRMLSAFGMFASAVTFILAVTDLVLPTAANTTQIGWLPIFIAEIATGVLLLVRGVRTAPAAVAAA